MKFYGSLNNRFEENKMFVDTIEVGTGVTEYLYTDRHAYEVTQVINQEHVFIRRMKAVRTDKNGMSDAQDYRYESTNDSEIELVKRNNVWYKVISFNKKEIWEAAQLCEICTTPEADYNYRVWRACLTDKQRKRLESGKEIKKYKKFGNISFGVMEEYFDYSF